ncbi:MULTISPECIES: hypothetical protein [Streptococcus anginosus group]|uniref:Parvulin-like peptidyl-prolyl isomerase n=3 Tax=Streptococcus anginosus TaxID=1328 RepID=A0AAP6EM64_STRAP|nr:MULTISPECIES: hypothetical protein [Streptococcus anginosus group]AGU83844.1 hypothetical protein SANR_1406 [Streptococcus anginosus C238]EJP25049.1 hypothetical protein HMPREF1126_1533 [Streptococcus anginosus SK1138]KXU01862.1 hypothetical protein SCODD09_00954 [Streptococcus constellatus]MDP1384419.1 hypothetical protein [Streptococcus anginosus]MDX5016103.1 hypothetical protein [Streptococcus anginosus]
MKMLDMEKLKQLKVVGIIVGSVLLLMIAFGLGNSMNHKPKSVKPKVTHVTKKKGGTELTQSYVKDFLIAYFTKKDLGENRNRYLPFMTEGAYHQEVNKENDPANQAYKGYVVDAKLKTATIYIDTENKVALVKVSYTNTLLQKKKDYSKAQTDVGNQSTLRLTYTKIDGRYLITTIEPILIVDTLNAEQAAAVQNQTTMPSGDNKGENDDNH